MVYSVCLLQIIKCYFLFVWFVLLLQADGHRFIFYFYSNYPLSPLHLLAQKQFHGLFRSTLANNSNNIFMTINREEILKVFMQLLTGADNQFVWQKMIPFVFFFGFCCLFLVSNITKPRLMCTASKMYGCHVTIRNFAVDIFFINIRLINNFVLFNSNITI